MSEQRYSQFMFDHRAEAERRLWASVLLSIIHDLCAPHRNFPARRDVELWIGAFPSSDFREVTSLAGLDPEAVWVNLSEIAALPHEDRPWIRDFSGQVKSERRNKISELRARIHKPLDTKKRTKMLRDIKKMVESQ